MNRIRGQQRRHFVQSSLWLVPVMGMVAALVAAPLVRWIDDQTRWTLMGFGADGARNLVGALASSLLTFIVFALSLMLLAVQMASGQLTPRIINRLFEGRRFKLVTCLFVFSWVYSLAAVGRIEERVPQLPVALAMALSLVSVGAFLYLVQGIIQSMRPVSVLTGIANDTREVIDAVYPAQFSKDGGEHAGLELDRGTARKTVRYRGHSSVVLAFEVDGLAEIATRAGCTVEIIPQVGDFLATEEELFRLYGAGADAASETELLRCISLGRERTLEQDPAFGFRIIVDIASRALSPAINDPTTAVLAIDQLHHLLHLLGQRQLDTGVVRDASGAVRLVYRTPDWEDFVTLAATEIRLYGATSPQVTRRLQAMLERVLRTVPQEREGALRQEASLLLRTIERSFDDPVDRELALRGDLQGFGSRDRGRDPASR